MAMTVGDRPNSGGAVKPGQAGGLLPPRDGERLPPTRDVAAGAWDGGSAPGKGSGCSRACGDAGRSIGGCDAWAWAPRPGGMALLVLLGGQAAGVDVLWAEGGECSMRGWGVGVNGCAINAQGAEGGGGANHLHAFRVCFVEGVPSGSTRVTRTVTRAFRWLGGRRGQDVLPPGRGQDVLPPGRGQDVF